MVCNHLVHTNRDQNGHSCYPDSYPELGDGLDKQIDRVKRILERQGYSVRLRPKAPEIRWLG